MVAFLWCFSLPVFDENSSFNAKDWHIESLGISLSLNEISSKITLNITGVKFV